MQILILAVRYGSGAVMHRETVNGIQLCMPLWLEALSRCVNAFTTMHLLTNSRHRRVIVDDDEYANANACIHELDKLLTYLRIFSRTCILGILLLILMTS